MPKSWFKITATAQDKAEVSIYDAIGMWGVSARQFVRDLKAIKAKEIALRIHSPGGDVFEGNAIFNALKNHPAKITTYIDGLAASMASIVALAGESVHIAGNGMIMIHNPSMGSGGDANQMRKNADLLDKVRDTMLNTYEKKTGMTREELVKMLDEETWMTAAEAKEHGFVDVIDEEMKAAACADFDLTGFRRTPEGLRVDKAGNEKMKILTASLATFLATASGVTVTENSTEAEVQAALDKLSGKVTSLETDRKTVIAHLATATGVALTEASTPVEVKAAVDKLTGQVTALQGEKTTLTGQLDQANGKITRLEGEAKTTTQRATEIAAANGVAPVAKGNESVQVNGGNAGKTHYEAYQAAMTEGRGMDAAQIWDAHRKEIEAYVATIK